MQRLTLTCVLAMATATAYSQTSAGLPGRPPKVTGSKIPGGVRIVSEEQDDPFSLEITATSFRAIASDRLAWLVDGNVLALSTELRRRRSQELLPLSDQEELRTLRQVEVRDAATFGWQAKTAEEQFQFPDGRKALFWSLSRNREVWLQAAALNGDYLVILGLAASNLTPQREAELRQYVKGAMLTLKHEATHASRVVAPNPHQTGTPLQTQREMEEKSANEPHVILINSSQATNSDAALDRVISLDPITLEELARLRLELPMDEPQMVEVNGKIQPVYSMKQIQARSRIIPGVPGPVLDTSMQFRVSVFDGESSHVIVLRGFDSATGLFKYWDSWPKGSFLVAGSNKASVAAKPSLDEEQTWTVTDDEMTRVLYAMVMPMREIIALSRLSAAVAGTPDDALLTYEALRAQHPDSDEVTKEHLNTVAGFLSDHKQYRQALAMYRAEFALYPPDPAKKARVVARFIAADYPDAARSLDAPPPASPSRRTGRLQDAEQDEFFKFFHLKQTAAGKHPELGELHTYRPSGDAFHDMVEVWAVPNENRTVNLWALWVQRSFIQDPDTRRFATDIVNSFLRFAIDVKPGDRVDRVAQEIRDSITDRRTVPVPAARHSGTRIHAFPSLAHNVFAGSEPTYDLSLNDGLLHMDQSELQGAKYLRIVVAARR